ncbi:MAG TPA: hypothetical protein VIL36_17410 [Acidimicrobiales bacterium]
MSDQGHTARRIDNRARDRADHAAGRRAGRGTVDAGAGQFGNRRARRQRRQIVQTGRPWLAATARTRTTTTSGRRRRIDRGLGSERPEPTLRPEAEAAPEPAPEPDVIDLPRLAGTGRTARAALASLAVHDQRPPQGRARR